MNTTKQTVLQGIKYGLSMFGVGFICGTVRVVALEPVLGRLLAVLMELPFMTFACWRISRNHHPMSQKIGLLLGTAALLTLLGCEVVMLVVAFGNTMSESVQQVLFSQHAAARLGLAAQVLCSFLPCISTTENRSH